MSFVVLADLAMEKSRKKHVSKERIFETSRRYKKVVKKEREELKCKSQSVFEKTKLNVMFNFYELKGKYLQEV